MRILQRDHRDEALRFLSEGRASSMMPPLYIEALMAAHRGDTARAIERAEDAARETPWFFEARLLQAHLQFEEAVKLYLSGEMENAAAKAALADVHYAQAQRIAESSTEPHVGRCAVSGLMLHMAQHGLATDAVRAHEDAEFSCSRALVVDPDHAEAVRLYSDAARAWANVHVRNNTDPGDAYERASTLAERAVQLSGGDVDALLTLADTFLDRAWYEGKNDKDPRDNVDRAIATYQKALVIDPRNLTGTNNMGMAYMLRSRYEVAQGIDASGSQDRCIASYESALRVDPELAHGFRNLRRAALERADEHERRGVNPVPALEEVAHFLDQLPGDRTFSHRVEAVKLIRERIAATVLPVSGSGDEPG
jgi:tetratricopeptide (TPR) repeat protein